MTPYLPPSAFYVPVEDDPCPECGYDLGIMKCIVTDTDHDVWRCSECNHEWAIPVVIGANVAS